MFLPLFRLEFTLSVNGASAETLRTSLIEYTQEFDVRSCGSDPGSERQEYRINLVTEDPTLIFDLCSQYGRLKSVKVQEEKRK